MDEFGYLAVILSIILGLSVTQLLQGLSQVINARDRVRIRAGDWMGAAAAPHRCAGVVGNVWLSQPAYLDLSSVRHPSA